MPDTSLSDLEVVPPTTSVTIVSGGVDLDAGRDVVIGGDVVGRDKITTIGYTVEQVSTLLTQISSTFQPKPFDGRCPYLGLDYFSEDDADRFFGRETLVSELVVRVKESRFVVIAGPSGSGKSSLVRAGLIHALKQGMFPNSDRWLYATLTPGRDPIESLALAMSRMAKSPDAGKYVREHSAEPGTLHEVVESQLSDHKDQRAVIFVDQFEEVFTQASTEDERAAFLNLLTHAATHENGRVTVLFALRSDFVSNCATYPQLNALLNQQFMQVGAMQPDELVSAIARPALQVGLRIDPDLIAQIVNDMQDEPGALPLMQFALKDLFDAQQAKGDVIALTLNDYLERGNLRKALERHADAAFAQLSESEQQLARTIFSGLIEVGRGTQDTRRTATLNELAPANVDTNRVETVMQKLADARLVTTDKRSNEYTLTHEKLINAWPWLRKLINENREAISLQNQIAEDAQEWNEHQCEASYLYTGARLATAREELAGQRIVLSELAQQFLTASIGAEEFARQREKVRQQQEIRRLRVRNRIITVAGVAALVAAIAAILLGLRAEQQAQIAFYRQLAAESTARLLDNYDLALLLSAETGRLGNELGDSYEGRDSLLKALESNPKLVRFFFGHFDRVSSLALSKDGHMLATGSDQSITLWDAMTRQRLGEPLTGDFGEVVSLAFSTDGKILASGSDAGINLWDVTTRQRLGRPLTGDIDIGSLAFSPDGKTLASGGDERITLWDMATRQRLGEPFTTFPHSSSSRKPIPENYRVNAENLAFSSDGKTLAAISHNRTDWLDVDTFRHLDTSNDLTDTNLRVSINPERMLATKNGDGIISLWDMTPYHRLAVLRTYNSDTASVAFSSDGQTLAFSRDNSVILWDVATRNPLGEPLRHSSRVTAVDFSPDGQTLAVGNTNGSINLWNVATSKRLDEFVAGHSDAVKSIAFSNDGKTLISVGSGESIILWDVVTRQRLGEPLASHSGSTTNVAFSQDGQTIAGVVNGDSIVLWNVATRQRLGEPLAGHPDVIESVAFSPGGQMLAAGYSDGNIILWNVATRKPLGEPLRHSSRVTAVDFSPDGQTLAAGYAATSAAGYSDRKIILWDVSSRRQLGEALAVEVAEHGLAFSPDGKTLASGGADGYIILWDVDPESWKARVCDIAGRNLTRQEWSRYFGERGEPYRKTCDEWPLEPEATPTPMPTPTP